MCAGRFAWRRVFPALLLAAGLLPAADEIEFSGYRWKVPLAKDWEVSEGGGLLRLLVARPAYSPRRPSQYAIAQTDDFAKVTFEAEVKKEPYATREQRTSLIVVYAWQDPDHFNYAHLSVDTGEQQVVHNGIFHVYGGERVRISPRAGPATLTGEAWHRVRLEFDGAAGEVRVYVNGQTSPAMHAVDLSLSHGKVGLGSFFNLGEFRQVKIAGTPK